MVKYGLIRNSMKAKLLIFIAIISSFALKAQNSGATNQASDLSTSSQTNEPVLHPCFLGLDILAGNFQTAPAFNNWLNNNGFYKNNTMALKGLSEIGFRNKWMFDYSYIGNSSSASINISNMTFGAGYQIANIHDFKIYGGLKMGLNMITLIPNMHTSLDATQVNLNDGSDLVQYSLIASPHIMIMRDFGRNLSRRPNRVSRFCIGLDFGYQQNLSESKWFYGYANEKPFYAVAVSEVPNSSFGGFYGMLKLGLYLQHK